MGSTYTECILLTRTHRLVEERHQCHKDDQDDGENVPPQPFSSDPEPPIPYFCPADYALLIFDPLVFRELFLCLVHDRVMWDVRGGLGGWHRGLRVGLVETRGGVGGLLRV